MAIEDMRDHEIAATVLIGYPPEVVTLGVGLIRAEHGDE